MFRFFLSTLPIFCVGLYLGLRFSHWLGEDAHSGVIEGIMVAEQAARDSALWLKDWVFSFFGGAQE